MNAIARAASMSENFIPRDSREALARAIRFTEAGGGLLFAELDLSKALNLGQLVYRIDRLILMLRQCRMQLTDCRLRSNLLHRGICLLYRTRAQPLRQRTVAVAEQVSDQHFANILL